MKALYIVRGLPGSGKSTIATQLTNNICEADQYFAELGRFDAFHIKKAHHYCQSKCRDMMESGVSTIAVSNTFTMQWEIEPYRALAEKYEYSICEIIMNNNYGSIHNVPAETIQRMKERFEV